MAPTSGGGGLASTCSMLLERGSKILVVHRRLFEQDRARYFLGTVDEYENGIVKTTGHTWLQDPNTKVLFRKDDIRTKVVAAGSGTVLLYALPETVDLAKIRFFSPDDGRFMFTDDAKFVMDISEVEYLRDLKRC